ncbi:hypothetical protein AtEden1_Chr1g0037901 [Arabidopsis thaliana]
MEKTDVDLELWKENSETLFNNVLVKRKTGKRPVKTTTQRRGEKFVSKGRNKGGNKSQKKAEKWCDFCTCDDYFESDCWKKQHRDVSLPTGVRCFVRNKPWHVVKNYKVRKAERANLSLEETNEESDNEGHVEERSSSNVNDETVVMLIGISEELQHL